MDGQPPSTVMVWGEEEEDTSNRKSSERKAVGALLKYQSSKNTGVDKFA